MSTSALTVPNDLFAGKPVNAVVTAGNWTNDPLEIEATVDVPAGWTTQPVRVTVPPGRTLPIHVPVTPAPVAFPEPGVQPEVTLTGRAVPVGGGRSTVRRRRRCGSSPIPRCSRPRGTPERRRRS